MQDRGPFFWLDYTRDKHLERFKCELAERGVDYRDHGNNTAIQVALEFPAIGCFRHALASGADPNALVYVRPGLISLLCYATLNWALDGFVAELLRHGAAVDAQDEYGQTALFYAASRRNVGAMRLLLDAGANALQNDRHDWTPLDRLAWTQRDDAHLDCARMLLLRGVTVGDRVEHWQAVLDIQRRFARCRSACLALRTALRIQWPGFRDVTTVMEAKIWDTKDNPIYWSS